MVEALEALNKLSGETMTLFVVDREGKLVGSLTDGDIRRALLRAANLDSPVEGICNRQCLRINEESDSGSMIDVIAAARSKGISLLPVVRGNVVVRLIDLRRRKGLVPADAVLMAGGIGERLRPLTLETPKPLLPVGDSPIIDHNVSLLRDYGIDNIFVAVNYLKEKIIEHFNGREGITCVEEPRKLGTIGALSLIEGFSQPNVLVMNADLLTDINLEAMYLRHLDTEAWLTVAVVPYPVSVPFAIVDHEGDRVTGITEKPTFNHYANAGIYLLSRQTVDLIPRGTYMDAPDLVKILLEKGRRVSLFAVEGRWLDIGTPADYALACSQ